jgi:hypothetical protein
MGRRGWLFFTCNGLLLLLQQKPTAAHASTCVVTAIE